MLERLRERDVEEASDRSFTVELADSGVTRTPLFRLGRLIYGGVLAWMAIDGLRNAEARAEYAASKGVPMPKFATNAAHAILLFGGVGISLWRAPALAASTVVTFFAGVTPQMHDFWNLDDPEQRQQEAIQFLKNTALLGTALALLGIAREAK